MTCEKPFICTNVPKLLLIQQTPHGVNAPMSRVMSKPTFWFPTWSGTNQTVQIQKMARGLKFRISKVEGLYRLCSENKGADQLRGYREADQRLYFRLCIMYFFFHDAAHI